MSHDKKAQALAQLPGPRCTPADIWQNMGVGHCLAELGTPRSWVQLGCSV